MNMERNILLTIEYDGTDFYGWQKQPDKRTVQGELERVLTLLCNHQVMLNGTSRTDSGVHALGQRASFLCKSNIPVDRIQLAANNMLAGGQNFRGKVADVRIIKAEEMPLDFHARFDSKGKTYRYVVSNHSGFNTFRRNYCYQIKEKLDRASMRKAAKLIVGGHDFKCFQSAGGTPRETTFRTIYSLDILDKKDDLIIEVTGDGFLYNMVRIIVGTLVDVGLGKIKWQDVERIILGGDRQKAGHTAPPQGLYLVKVFYTEINEREGMYYE